MASEPDVIDLSIEEAGRVFTDPTAYADEPRFHAACALLRREAPVHRVEAEGFNPFWAVTKHADVMEVERQHERWLNAPRPVLGPKAGETSAPPTGMPIRTLMQMDAPDHPVYRHITSDWFIPKSVARLDDRIAELAKRYVDRMADLGGECDFVTDVAVHYPLYVILSILGLPEEDFPRMLKLTQELFGDADPELARGTTPEGAHADAAGLLRVLPGAHRGSSRPPDRRLGVGDRQRGARRRADRHLRGGRLLRDHRDRRTRHDDRRRSPEDCTRCRASRPARAADW